MGDVGSRAFFSSCKYFLWESYHVKSECQKLYNYITYKTTEKIEI